MAQGMGLGGHSPTHFLWIHRQPSHTPSGTPRKERKAKGGKSQQQHGHEDGHPCPGGCWG